MRHEISLSIKTNKGYNRPQTILDSLKLRPDGYDTTAISIHWLWEYVFFV